MTHFLTTPKTADQVEAEGVELAITLTEVPRPDISSGDPVVVTSSDRCQFIGDVIDVGPAGGSVRIKLS